MKKFVLIIAVLFVALILTNFYFNDMKQKYASIGTTSIGSDDYASLLKAYAGENQDHDGYPLCANPKECADFSDIIKAYVEKGKCDYKTDSTVWYSEKMMSETAYPKCPKDIPSSLYYLMLTEMDGNNLYVDCQHYLRMVETKEMIEEDGKKETKEETRRRNQYLSKIYKECKEYKAANIHDSKLKDIAILNIRDLKHRFDLELSDKITDNQDLAILEGIQKRIHSTPEYKRIEVDTSWTNTYMQKFLSSITPVEPRMEYLRTSKLNTRLIMRTLCLLQHEENFDNQCIEAMLISRDVDDPFCLMILEHIMDSGKYSQWLPLVWKQWRYTYAMMFCSPSKDGAIPNWYYNNRKLKVWTTILRHLNSQPDDIYVRTAACFLLNDSNIQLYGPFPYGNQIVNEQFLPESNNKHEL